MLEKRYVLPFLLALWVAVSWSIADGAVHVAAAQAGNEPSIGYGSYLGGNSDDRILAAAVDEEGNLYLAGATYSTDLAALDVKTNGSEDMLVLSLDPTGNRVRWMRVIGGRDTDQATGVALDARGQLWVTGLTGSADFPVTAGDAAFAGYYDVVAMALDTGTGATRFATLFGNSSADQGNAVAVSAAGTVYITGQMSDDSGFRDVLVLALDSGTYALQGGVTFGRARGEDMGSALALDESGNVYVTGQTTAQGQDTDFPLVNALQATCGVGDGYGDCGQDAFVTVLDAGLENVLYSTYLGGSYAGSELGNGSDAGMAIAVADDGSIYVAGQTSATDFPVANAVQATKAGADNFYDAFAVRLNPANNRLIFSTYLGGAAWDEAHALALDTSGAVTIAGMTSAQDFPVHHGFQGEIGNGICNVGGSERYCYDGFVVRLDPAGELLWSSYLGGSYDDDVHALAVDRRGRTLLVGGTESHNFPVTTDAPQPAKALQQDGFVTWLGGRPSVENATVYLPFVRR